MTGHFLKACSGFLTAWLKCSAFDSIPTHLTSNYDCEICDLHESTLAYSNVIYYNVSRAWVDLVRHIMSKVLTALPHTGKPWGLVSV